MFCSVACTVEGFFVCVESDFGRFNYVEFCAFELEWTGRSSFLQGELWARAWTAFASDGVSLRSRVEGACVGVDVPDFSVGFLFAEGDRESKLDDDEV